jgi:hypothetical protein
MKSHLSTKVLRVTALSSLLLTSGIANAQDWRLIAITGQQTDNTMNGTEYVYPDHTLFEINPTTGALTKLFQLPWVNDSQAIGYNPDNQLLYHTGGSESYSNNPGRTGHDQGGPTITGVGYQDSQYMETVNLSTGALNAIFNAAPCPNPDPTLPCFGLPAPRPTWVVPAEQRNSTQIDSSFEARGIDEYHAARGLAWSVDKKLFYLADENGIFMMTPGGTSTFLGRPLFPSDFQGDEDKAIAFVTLTNLFVGHRNGIGGAGVLMKVDPETGANVGEISLLIPEGASAPLDNFGGILGLAQHPQTGVLYAVRETADNFGRDLLTINPVTGVAKFVGILPMHFASITFAQSGGTGAWKLIGITGQQGDATKDETGNFVHPDNCLFEINTTNATATKLFKATWAPDSQSIGYNPESGLLYHTAGSAAYRDDPTRTGHEQGGPDIPGLAFQDNQYIETINLATGLMTGVVNANPCPNPDSTLPCFGLPAPRPTWDLPLERRNSTQTSSSFREKGPNEYTAARGLAWSKNKHLFYLSDPDGIFKVTAAGDSTFLARPTFSDGQADENKSIAFVVTTNLWVGHRNPSAEVGLIMQINPETAEPVGELQITYPEGGAAPVDSFGGLLGLAQHPVTGVIYGVRATDNVFLRELVTIDPLTGATKLVAPLNMHVASLVFAQNANTTVTLSVTNQTANTITISWIGGSGKFLLQKNIDLNTTNWMPVLTTTEHSATVLKDGTQGYFRVIDNYTGEDVIPLTAFLSADAERSAVTGSPTGTGTATLSVQGTNKVNWLVTYQGLSSSANNAHIHGFTNTTGSTGVKVGFATPSGTNGTIMGSAAITEDIRTNLLNGNMYVNIHTVNNPGGEIRGQALRTKYTATLNGANERPTPVTTPATGTATISIWGKELKYDVTFANLTAPATAAHIHGRADANSSTNVIQGFTGVTAATSGAFTGTVTVNQAVLAAIVDGLAYVNIHNTNNPSGEIRGQLAP